MAKIICITTGLTGILNASFELVHRLKKEGHEVIYASPRKVAERVVLQNIRFIQLPRIELEYEGEIPKFKGVFKKTNRLFFKIKNAKKRRKEALDILNPKGFTKMLETEKPDLLIIDIELHEYILRSFSRGESFILLSQWFSTWKRKGLPYLLHDTIPSKGWKGTPLAIKGSWRKVQLKRWWTFLRKKILSVGTDRRSLLLELAKLEGFPMRWIRGNYWPGPFSYDRLPVLSMTAQEMEFPHSVRPNLFYVGPMVFENRVDPVVKCSKGYMVEEVLDYREKIGGSLLYCSVSTLFKGDLNFIKKIIQAVGDQKKWILVLGLGGLLEKENFGEMPENVFAFSYVPQLKVLAKADCSINHGGIHTINECIHFKVPMLVYSGKKSDQNGCAARVHFHGLGIMADKDVDTAQEISKKINNILTDSFFQENVGKMQRHFEEYRKNSLLENIIHKQLRLEKINKH